MTEQQTDRERRAMWRQIATDAGDDPYVNTLHPDEVLTLLDQLDQLDQAEARVKAVQHLIDQADEIGEWAITCTRLQGAIDGSSPQPGA